MSLEPFSHGEQSPGADDASTAAGSRVGLRPALESDGDFVWRVNNQPSVREQSIRTKPIPIEAHRGWYADQLARDDCEILIACCAEDPLGVVRYELDAELTQATISIALAEGHRGRGVGRQLIRLVAQRIFEATAVDTLRALVRPTNAASVRAFQHGGFGAVGETEVSGVALTVFERHRVQDQGG